jgi:hypothetical protein
LSSLSSSLPYLLQNRKSMFKHYLWIEIASLLCTLVISFSSPAEEVELFDSLQRQSQNYNSKILSIKPGDSIRCGSHTYTVVRRLGAGNTTQIFDIGNGLALRVPKWEGVFRETSDYLSYIKQFQMGNASLQSYGVPVGNFNLEQSMALRCLVVSKYTRRFSLLQLIEFKKSRVEVLGPYGEFVPQEELEYALASLEDFLTTTWKIESVHDLHLENVLWTTEGWIAADYGSVTPAMPGRNITVVSHWRRGELSFPEFWDPLEKFVLVERQRKWGTSTPAFTREQALRLRKDTEQKLRSRFPYFNKSYFLKMDPRDLMLQNQKVLNAVPKVWFVDRIVESDGIEYFLKLPRSYQYSIITGLTASTLDRNSESASLGRRLYLLIRGKSQGPSCSASAAGTIKPNP